MKVFKKKNTDLPEEIKIIFFIYYQNAAENY